MKKDIFERADETYEQNRDDGYMWGNPHTKGYPLPKYKKNLRVEELYIEGRNQYRVYSYNTHVATIDGVTLKQHGYWSMTTQKHINYVADALNVTTILKHGETD